MKRLSRLIIVALLACSAIACGSHNPPIVNVTNAEHVTVVSVHGVVQAEAAAFKSGAYDNAKHQTYVAGLLKVAQSEKALNDALKTWNQASGQPAPAVVLLALNSLRTIVDDLRPLVPANSAVGILVDSASAAIAIIGGK